MFSWTRLPLNCATVTYEIQSSCGECPAFTSSTLVTCVLQNPLVNYGVCTFAVRSILCNNIVSGWSNEIEVILRGISLNLLTLIYSCDCIQLICSSKPSNVYHNFIKIC